MLHDLSNDGGFVALKRAAEDREGWRHRKDVKKTCSTAEDDDDAGAQKTTMMPMHALSLRFNGHSPGEPG